MEIRDKLTITIGKERGEGIMGGRGEGFMGTTLKDTWTKTRRGGNRGGRWGWLGWWGGMGGKGKKLLEQQ